MSAIITSKFRFENAASFIDSVANNSIYVMLGKSDAWSNSVAVTTDSAAPTPTDTIVEENDLWQNAIALKKANATDAINITLRHTWTTGTNYVPWDDADPDIFTKAFYVITEDYSVFKCLKAGSGASTVQPALPSGNNGTNPITLGDGYVWKYMFPVETLEATKFLTTSYMPVPDVPFPEDTAGKIYNYVISNSGSGYTSGTTLTVHGNGTGASISPIIGTGIDAGKIVGITINDLGSGYTNAYVTVSGAGSNAVIRPVLAPRGGHGADPIRELGAYYAGVRVLLVGTEGGTDFIVNAAFRQLAIAKNPYTYGTTTVATATTLSALKQLNLSSHTGLNVGDYIVGGTSGAVAYIDSYDSVTGILKYHQNDKTGYTPFRSAGENITGHTGGSGVIPATGGFTNPEVQPFSGQILFVENRAPINRSASQIEDVKIIIEF